MNQESQNSRAESPEYIPPHRRLMDEAAEPLDEIRSEGGTTLRGSAATIERLERVARASEAAFRWVSLSYPYVIREMPSSLFSELQRAGRAVSNQESVRDDG